MHPNRRPTGTENWQRAVDTLTTGHKRAPQMHKDFNGTTGSSHGDFNGTQPGSTVQCPLTNEDFNAIQPGRAMETSITHSRLAPGATVTETSTGHSWISRRLQCCTSGQHDRHNVREPSDNRRLSLSPHPLTHPLDISTIQSSPSLQRSGGLADRSARRTECRQPTAAAQTTRPMQRVVGRVSKSLDGQTGSARRPEGYRIRRRRLAQTARRRGRRSAGGALLPSITPAELWS